MLKYTFLSSRSIQDVKRWRSRGNKDNTEGNPEARRFKMSRDHIHKNHPWCPEIRMCPYPDITSTKPSRWGAPTYLTVCYYQKSVLESRTDHHRGQTSHVELALEHQINKYQNPVCKKTIFHYGDVIMSAMASQITSVTIVIGNFPAQRASNVSIWWHHHDVKRPYPVFT